jgi:hypothetical protein
MSRSDCKIKSLFRLLDLHEARISSYAKAQLTKPTTQAIIICTVNHRNQATRCEVLPEAPATTLAFLKIQSVCRDILDNHTISGYDSIIANCHAFKHHNISSQPDVVAYANRRGDSRLVAIHPAVLSHAMVKVVHMHVGTE